jgi:hypothetical protein
VADVPRGLSLTPPQETKKEIEEPFLLLHLLWPRKAALPLSPCHLALVITVDLFSFVAEGMWQGISSY